MKKTVFLVCVLWLATVMIPVFLLGDEPAPQEEIPDAAAEESAGDKVTEVFTETAQDAAVTVQVMVDGKEDSFRLGEYLEGVLAAEMPASFPAEALKAQAVAARSFILYRMAYPPSDGVHDGIPLCNDPAHCKAYRDISVPETSAALFGANSGTYMEKIRAAVRDTDGVVLTYRGDPAMAAFHAISGGMTESAEDVWGTAVPYLVAVESPGEEDALKFSETVEFQRDALRTILEQAYPDAALGENPSIWLTQVCRSSSGMIQTASLGGVTVSGMEIRMLLGLNSADFTWEVRDDTVLITTTGYGHGVGMSQYGARAMAQEGSDFKEILLYYYTGCTFSSLSDSMVLAEY